MARDIKKTLGEALRQLEAATDIAAVEGVFRAYAGKKGELKLALKELKDIADAERREFGESVNTAIAELTEAIALKRTDLEGAMEEVVAEEAIDVTHPVAQSRKGGLHILTVVRRDAEEIFRSMGFSVATGPHVEDARRNFDALNIPADHPARDLWDTFWLKEGAKERTPGSLLMRTHTSPVQIRHMESDQPPFRIIAPGETYRYEATDASHEFQFAQIEGLMG